MAGLLRNCAMEANDKGKRGGRQAGLVGLCR